MSVKIIKHFNQHTPLSEASNDEELAKILCLRYPNACSSLEVDASAFSRMVEEVRQHSAWRVLGFQSMKEFCEKKLGRTIDEVNRIIDGVNNLRRQGHTGPISESQALNQHGGDRRSEEAKENQVTNGHLKPASKVGPNSKERLTRKLKRDAPEFLGRLQAGEFKSVRQAAIAAGVLKVKSRLETIKASAAKLTFEERNDLIEYLDSL